MTKELAETLEPSVPQEEIDAASQAEPEAEAKAEAPKEKEQPKAEPEVKEEKLVRLEALHEERGKRKELQRKLEQLERQQRERDAVLNDRLSQLYAASQPKNEPDPNDPLAVHDHKLEITQRELQQLKQRQQQEDYQRQQQAQRDGLVAWAQAQRDEFVAETPDFQDAYGFVLNRRLEELKALGLPPQEIRRTLENDELWIYHHAYQAGKNPAEVIYKMAKNTGYTGKKEVPNEKKIETLQKGTEAAKSLGSGAAGSEWPTPEQIVAMDENEFAALKAKLSKKGKSLSDLM